ncbi:MAG: M81 family metallopeptidase [bacterium]
MKIAIAQVWQEANSFNPVLTGMKEFENFGYAKGKDVVKKFGKVSEIGGFVSEITKWKEKAEIVPLVRAVAWPGGPVERETYLKIISDLTEMLKNSLPIDGVLISLHGALMSEEKGDFDGEILKIIRSIVCNKIPVVATLDLHANITKKMVKNADALIPYHTAPHIDVFETGERGAKVLYRILKEKKFPSCCWIKIPMIIASEKHNVFVPPMKDLFDIVHQVENNEDVWSASLCIAQPWLDVSDHGWCAMAWGTDIQKMKQYVGEISLKSWKMRKELDAVERVNPETAVSEALTFDGKPVVIADGADATNSGAPGDSTILLKKFLENKSEKVVLITVVDPEIAQRAFTTGKGKVIKGRLGGKRDNIFSSPVGFEGIVINLSDGKYIMSGHGGKNLPVSTGKTAVIKIKNIFVVVSEYPGPGSHPLVYKSVGLEPKKADIVVVKSPAGFRADYEPFAKKVILADCPGLASPHYKSFPYKTERQHFYPWEEDFEWVPEVKFK